REASLQIPRRNRGFGLPIASEDRLHSLVVRRPRGQDRHDAGGRPLSACLETRVPARGKRESVVTKRSVGAGWQRAVIALTGTGISVVVIATLYWAQSVFIPVALAGFLTFLLSPFVGWFRQRGLGRTPAVILVVLMAGAALGGIGWLVT